MVKALLAGKSTSVSEDGIISISVLASVAMTTNVEDDNPEKSATARTV